MVENGVKNYQLDKNLMKSYIFTLADDFVIVKGKLFNRNRLPFLLMDMRRQGFVLRCCGLNEDWFIFERNSGGN